jgi:hypothetical protein
MKVFLYGMPSRTSAIANIEPGHATFRWMLPPSVLRALR